MSAASSANPVYTMAEFKLGQPADNALAFLVERATAIEHYAQVEQSLSHLFSDLLGTTFQLGGIVFFRMTNTNARNAVIGALLEQRHGSTYEAFWNGTPNTPHRKGLFTLLRTIDSRRNEIVHWHTVNNVHVENDKAVSILKLARPNSWSFPGEMQQITVTDMQAFSAMADFVTRVLNMFALVVSGRHPGIHGLQTWQDIFQRPCTYPPAEGHPLARTPPAP